MTTYIDNETFATLDDIARRECRVPDLTVAETRELSVTNIALAMIAAFDAGARASGCTWLGRDQLVTLTAIARETLVIPTLETRGSDMLDFHFVHTFELREALAQAYAAGSGGQSASVEPATACNPQAAGERAAREYAAREATTSQTIAALLAQLANDLETAAACARQAASVARRADGQNEAIGTLASADAQIGRVAQIHDTIMALHIG